MLAEPEGPGVGVLRYSGLISCEGENGDCAGCCCLLVLFIVRLLLANGESEGNEAAPRLGDTGREGAGITLAFLARRRMSRRERAYLPAGTRSISILDSLAQRRNAVVRVRRRDTRLTFRQDIGQLVDIFGRLFQVELVREESGDTDQKGRSKGGADVRIMHSVA